jgi:pimeloyl-ACP methyl ester carboxylesterase
MPYVLASDEVPLYYTSHGQGPVIVLIHGFSMNGGFFRHNVPELARGHRVVTMDLRGHGHSGKQEHNWTLPQAARDVRLLLEQLDLHDVILAGWSMGATVIFNYLQQFGGDRLRGLGIIDMTPYLLTEPGWDYAAFHNALGADAALGTVRDLWADRLALLTNFVSACFAEGTDPDPDTVDQWLHEIMLPPAGAAAAFWTSMVCQDWRPLLSRIDLPVLLCYGARSRIYAPELGPYLHQKLADSTLVTFDHSGHSPFWEEPEKFNAELGRFVDAVATADARRARPGEG